MSKDFSSNLSNDREIIAKSVRNDPNLDVNNTFYVIAINLHSVRKTVEWFLQLLQSQQGSQETNDIVLKVTTSEKSDDCSASVNDEQLFGDEIVIQIGFNEKSLLKLAEKFNLKLFRNGQYFYPSLTGENVKVLTYSEKQKVLLLFLESLHVTEKGVLFGYPNVKLYPGQSILQLCERESIVRKYFPIHCEKELHSLRQNWCLNYDSQPINEIRNYFGESIAFYFAFLEFYTKALIPPSIISFSQFFLGSFASPFCALFNVIWCILFLKYWKRRSNDLAYRWGTLHTKLYEEPRPAFKGKSLAIDPVTEKQVPIYPIQKTWMKEYGVSLPVVFVCLYISFQVMILYFQIETSSIMYYKENPSFINGLMTNVPGIVYALVVMVMSAFYRVLAARLNNWENHRTQSSHESHLIIKLVLFEFVNNFMSIFYVAFYIQDMSMLKWQIGTMLIVNQVVDNLQEVLIPLWTTRNTIKEVENLKRQGLKDEVVKIVRETKMPVYEDTYFDYLELFIQFGYVFLFASVFPFAPVLALVNNLIELRSDSFKLCYAYQRPHQRSSSGINSAWLKTFEVMGVIAVVTNCSLTLMSPLKSIMQDIFVLTDLQAFLAIIGFEHIVLSLILVMNYVIPDLPKKVRIAIAKDSLCQR